MIITKTVLMFLTFLLIIAIFVAKVSNLISVEVINNSNEVTQSDITIKNTTINNKLEHLIWFLQISDIHISIFQDHKRITELREFCDLTLDAINPKVVIASGDLTDAKTKDHIGSRQYEAEWQYYSNILKECGVQQKTVWLDVRGNHDNFNVPYVGSKENFYKNYSIQGKNNPRSYYYQINENGNTYAFIAVDACLDPGPRRPFNFVGLLSENEVNYLETLSKQAVGNGSKHIIWFGHYPTSCILTPGPQDIRSVLGEHQESLVYLCGHLHQLGGLVPNMYTLQKNGFLELELGDWKENRMYRLAAIDHGLFSFVDIRHRVWPVILITNPKHAKYVIPYREPAHLMAVSSHIRILAFSVSEILYVRVRIDDNDWVDCERSEGPLYVSKWNPSQYAHGIHTIRVQVRDESGRERTISQPFTFENVRLSFDILARIALMTNISTVFQLLFGILIIACVLPLCIFRFLHRLVKEGKMKKPLIKNRFIKNWIQKCWMLSTIDRLFFPLVLYPLYLSFGPWSFGYLLEDHLGIIFAWGIFIRGAYLPGSFTYAYGFLQMLIFHFPLILILANCVHYRVRLQTENIPKKKSIFSKFLFHLPFLIIITIQALFAYCFWLAYDTLAFLLSPLRTWSIILAFYMWVTALTLPEKCTREAAYLWIEKTKSDFTEDQENDTSL